MRPTAQEISSLGKLLDAGVITSRAALLITLLHDIAGSCQIGPLAVSLGVSIPRVSMLGDTLVKFGLVDRCVPASDLRKATLALTVKGYKTSRAHLLLLREFGAV